MSCVQSEVREKTENRFYGHNPFLIKLVIPYTSSERNLIYKELNSAGRKGFPLFTM